MKCSNCSICYGLVNVIRDVAGEEAADIERATNASARRGSAETTGMMDVNSPRPSAGAYSVSAQSPARAPITLNRL